MDGAWGGGGSRPDIVIAPWRKSSSSDDFANDRYLRKVINDFVKSQSIICSATIGLQPQGIIFGALYSPRTWLVGEVEDWWLRSRTIVDYLPVLQEAAFGFAQAFQPSWICQHSPFYHGDVISPESYGVNQAKRGHQITITIHGMSYDTLIRIARWTTTINAVQPELGGTPGRG